MIYKRNITQKIVKSLKNNPVVMINGSRQVGKSTLIEMLSEKEFPIEYITLDNHNILFASSNDPYGFLSSYNSPLAIDEIQRNPELLIAIKRIVDENKRTGSFLLTGSANVLTIPKVSESLAGRMVLHTLWPLSQGELRGKMENFVNWAFNEETIPSIKNKLNQNELFDIILKGGYPRSILAEDYEDRMQWVQSYLNSIIQRDIMSLSKIEGLKEIPQILAVLAGRVGNLLNLSDISRMIKLGKMTLSRYYSLLRMVYLVVELPAWYSNTDKRLSKSPKIYLNDTALVSYFKKIDKEVLVNNRSELGAILENFVVMELYKQLGWQEKIIDLYHFRTQTGKEVDVVIEGSAKKIVGIEIKSTTKVDGKDLEGLKELRSISGKNFNKGIILYTGNECLKLEDKIYALPLNSLWEI